MDKPEIKQTLKVAAGMGKGEDRYIGHLAHGEIILTNAFQKEYPGLVDDLRKAFERVGINMNRYIVGHKENRINQDTGMPMYAEGMDGGGEGPGGGGGYGDGGGNDSGGAGDTGGGRGDGGGDGGGNTPDPTPVEEPKPAPTPPPPPPTPLTPETTGINLGYAPIPDATVTPATPTAAPAAAPTATPKPTNQGWSYNAGTDNTIPAPSLFKGATGPGDVSAIAAPAGIKMASPDPIMTKQAMDFAKLGFASPDMSSLPSFADGGIVDAALKKVSNKYSDTGLPLSAMQILSKIAKSG